MVIATLQPPPVDLGVTHWSSRLLADHLRGRGLVISNVRVARIWRKWGLQPWRRETFTFSTDPELEAEVESCVLQDLIHFIQGLRLTQRPDMPDALWDEQAPQRLNRTASGLMVG